MSHLQLQLSKPWCSLQDVVHLIWGRVQVFSFQNQAGDHPVLTRLQVQPRVPKTPKKKKLLPNPRTSAESF